MHNSHVSVSNQRRLLKDDYNKSCKELAFFLLGKILVRKLEDGNILMGKIVETECYLGGEDKASHSYKGKLTKRNEPMYMPAGTTYVYSLYFGYHCFNISSLEPGAAVLLRALEPVHGINIMKDFRVKTKKLNIVNLCNGPSKLCIAMNITKDNSNKLNLADPYNDQIWLEDNLSFNEATIVNTSRIGIGSTAEEWVTKPLRYYVLNNKYVSKKDRKAEKLLESTVS